MIKPLSIYVLMGVFCIHQPLMKAQIPAQPEEMQMVEKGSCCKPKPSCCFNPCSPTACPPKPCNPCNSCKPCCREMEEGPMMMEKGCCKPRPNCCLPCNPTSCPPKPCNTCNSCKPCCRDYDMIDVKDVNPSIMCEMRYASENNCTKQALCSNKCMVRTVVAKALDAVQKELEMMGMCLKVWDAYRPMSMQEKLWKACSDERYMVNPMHPDYHCCGLAVDVTMVDLMTAEECEMPSDFNEFSMRAHCQSSDCSMMAQRNYHILHDVMMKHGFKSYDAQWHYFYFDQCPDCMPLDMELE